MMKPTLPEEVILTLMLRRSENDPSAYDLASERSIRERLAERLDVHLAADEEFEEADEGFWTSCDGCGFDLVYLQGVAETLCRACHYEAACLVVEVCEGECEVYP